MKNKKKPTIKKLPKYALAGTYDPNNPNQTGDIFAAQDQNQYITNGDQNSGVYSDANGKTYGQSNNQPSTGQYVAAGTAALAGGANMANTYQNKDATVAQGWNAGADTGATVVGAFNPILGMAIGATNKIGNNIRTNQIEKTNADGTLKNKKFAEATAFTQTVANPLTWGSMLNKKIYTPDQYGDTVERENKQQIANQQAAQFPMGGVNPNVNAEVELSENSIAPNGEFTQYNGPSHEQGGIPVNMEPGERIYSDRLKVPGTKKTFAELNKKNNTNKQDKILEDSNSTSVAKSTAKLIADIKRQKSDRLFQEQEALKQSKVQAYAKKMGLNISNNFAKGGTKLPQYEDGGEETTSMMKEYGQNPNYENFWRSKEQNKTYQTRFDNDVRLANEQAQAYYGSMPNVPANPNYNPNANSPLLTPDERNAANPIPEDGNFMQQMNATAPGFIDPKTYNQYPKAQTQRKNPDYRNMTEAGVNTLLQNSGNIMDLYQTKFGKKYDKEDSGQLTSQKLSPKEAIAQAQVEARVNRNKLKDVTGGNVGSYLSNLTASQANNTMNKAKIYENFENINTGIANNDLYHNQATRMQDKANEQQNKARSEDIARNAVRGIGTNTSAAYRDYKANDMDQYSLDIISKAYPDYVYDKNKRGWFHKSTGKRLTPKGE